MMGADSPADCLTSIKGAARQVKNASFLAAVRAGKLPALSLQSALPPGTPNLIMEASLTPIKIFKCVLGGFFHRYASPALMKDKLHQSVSANVGEHERNCGRQQQWRQQTPDPRSEPMCFCRRRSSGSFINRLVCVSWGLSLIHSCLLGGSIADVQL